MAVIRTVDNLDNLSVVPDAAESMSEEDAQAEAALIQAFSDTRAREQREVAGVEIPRYANVPMRDASGRLIRDAQGKIVTGSLKLYFQPLGQGTLVALRKRFTHQEAVRRRGRTEFEDRTDDEGMTFATAYTAMVPWCRARYYEDPKLWGEDPVGTGEEFFRARLRLGEVSYCVEAVMQLEGLGDERGEQLGKSSARVER
jgi:hypothetical protein